MKIIVQKENLLKGINSVINALSTRTTDAILSGIYLEAKDNKLKLIATDSAFRIEYIIDKDIEIKEEGATVVIANTFSDIIRRMPEIDITIEVDENQILKIKSKGLNYKLSTMPAERFPIGNDLNKDNYLLIEQRVLKNLIRQTSFAVSNDEIRKVYTGVFINAEKDKITFVALDGFRLAIRTTKREIEKDPKKEFKAIVPGKYLNEVAKILDESFDHVKISIDDNQAVFEIENCKIITSLLEGDFLDYNSLIKNEHDCRVKINKDLLLDAFERVDLIAGVKEKREAVDMKVEIGKMNLSCNSTIGSANEELTVESEGENINLRFNSRYFLDALKNIEDEDIEILFNKNTAPCLIKPVEEKDRYTYIILPLRNDA